ncbi:hypothetical protein SK128_025989 [Halocaridina rubra]|uniref:Uncharacterized protein n=1 Tax=Halocaridina rubra TaxID=373956 RepID=A0AAN9A6N1_HALRR
MYLALGYVDERPPNFDIFGYPTSIKKRKRGENSSHQTPKCEASLTRDSKTKHNPFGPSKLLSLEASNSTESLNHMHFQRLLDTKTAKFYPSKAYKVIYDYSLDMLYDKYIPLHEYEVRMTMIWAPKGWKTIRKIDEWVNGTIYPDVIVISFAIWLALIDQMFPADPLLQFTEMEETSRDLINSTTKLASKTRVLLWGMARYRWYVYQEGKVKNTRDRYYWMDFVHLSRFNSSIGLFSSWQWRRFR